jgi:hypothetical protein
VLPSAQPQAAIASAVLASATFESVVVAQSTSPPSLPACSCVRFATPSVPSSSNPKRDLSRAALDPAVVVPPTKMTLCESPEPSD